MPISTERACRWISMSQPPAQNLVIGGVLRDDVVRSATLCVAVEADGGAPAGWWSDELMRLYEPTHWVPVPAAESPGQPDRATSSEAEGSCDETADPVLLDVRR